MADETTPKTSSESPEKPPASQRRPKLEAYHQSMLEAVVDGSTIEEASRTCGISRRTGLRWAKRHNQELRSARAALLDQAVGRSHARLMSALDVLHELATKPDSAAAEGANVRRGAAFDLVQSFERLARIGDLEARLSKLEASLAHPAPQSPAAPHRLTILTGNG